MMMDTLSPSTDWMAYSRLALEQPRTPVQKDRYEKALKESHMELQKTIDRAKEKDRELRVGDAVRFKLSNHLADKITKERVKSGFNANYLNAGDWVAGVVVKTWGEDCANLMLIFDTRAEQCLRWMTSVRRAASEDACEPDQFVLA